MSDWMESDTFKAQYNGAEDFAGRVPRPDEFPEDPSTSRSYWIRNHTIELDQIWRDRALPEETDVVIIGSGITGAVVAFQLSEQQPDIRVALLEARGICTGATGRNGGHICRPEVCHFDETVQAFGDEDAMRLKKFAIRNRDMMIECIEKLDATEKVSLRLNGTVVVFETENERDAFQKDIDYATSKGYKSEGYIIGPEEAATKLDLDASRTNFGAAILEKSGTIFPRKFVDVLLQTALRRMPSLTIHPYTAVESVSRPDSNNSLYKAHTTRGVIQSKAIFHATNAYAGHLNVDLQGADGVFGAKGHMLGINPNVTGCRKQLQQGFGYGDFWHYLQQRPGNGPFLYGFATAELLNDYDDRITLPADHEVRAKMLGFLERMFPEWFQNLDISRDVPYDWTGIQGFTMTGASIVGRPSKDSLGEFASVGHNGEGMGRCFASATVATEAMIAYLLGKSYQTPDWFPEAFRRNI
ncbi:FAD dependent oxidoreductase [Aaosphaeria arxii CBS 175.79]|uniref:FAD dependent oxidoreductase n=1 Tax=Aaosphaeria arxii CBS 175.79 TaxID=1450172 RepID=A0A6A5XJ70_9PLEO|nr:FAD dependent oxidoreductase [Aaosphaeria arxii CBS 175.79]KAF2012916.1 FAD dependent oxidoreductase [Aaosphaeria arxii CBS 175.79]